MWIRTELTQKPSVYQKINIYIDFDNEDADGRVQYSIERKKTDGSWKKTNAYGKETYEVILKQINKQISKVMAEHSL